MEQEKGRGKVPFPGGHLVSVVRIGLSVALRLLPALLCALPVFFSSSLAYAQPRTVPLSSPPILSLSYPRGRLTLAAGGTPLRLYLLSKRSGSLDRIDPENGQSIRRLSSLPSPEDLAVGPGGERIMISLDSSRRLLVLPVSAGPPLSLTVGLNPGQIAKSSNGTLYLAARAVHIVYRLSPDHSHTIDWMAVGDVFRQMSPDGKGDLWLPLSRGEQIVDLDAEHLRIRKSYDLESCRKPTRVLPLSGGGFVVGCRNALLSEDLSGEDVARVRLPSFRRGGGVRDMLGLPGGDRLMVSFRKRKILNIYHLPDLSMISSFRTHYLPVRLYFFDGWPIIFVVMDDPDHDKTWLFGYPLSAFGSLFVTKPASGPFTSSPRKTP